VGKETEEHHKSKPAAPNDYPTEAVSVSHGGGESPGGGQVGNFAPNPFGPSGASGGKSD